MSKITFSQAKEGYLLAAGARHLSEHTIRDYLNTFKKFSNFLDEDLPIEEITRHHIEAFLAAQTKVTNKTLLNYHVGLSALWTWAKSEHIVPIHVVREVTPPKPEQKEIIPFTVVEIRAMLEVVGRNTTGQVSNKHMKDSADRNRAILLLLLDTGMRASELCGLNFSQVDSHNRRVRVMGKGAKERTIPFSPRTGQTLWRYLTSRQDVRANDSLIATVDGHRLNRSRLQKILGKIGNRGGISKVHPHRFRHTFAIQYLRNGGDPYTLQALLGHSSLDMVKNYLRIAQIDIDSAHRRASPVDNWRL
jgi:site-specific recombinase XerD